MSQLDATDCSLWLILAVKRGIMMFADLIDAVYNSLQYQ